MGSLTESLTSEILMLFREASRNDHAKTSPQPEKVQESKASGLECGFTWRESSVKFDPVTRSWKTRQCSLLAGLDEFSETWPKWGMMRDGECWAETQPEAHTSEKESGSWLPRPLASDNRSRGDFTMPSIHRRMMIGKQIGLSCYFKGAPCPMCVERIMRWPMGWTDLQPLETGKTQQWLDLHGRRSPED
jgi:hypothetical protein